MTRADPGAFRTPAEVFWDDLTVNDRIGGLGVTVTEAHVVLFGGLVGDHLPIHTDDTVAAASRFGRRIAQGPLVMAAGLGLLTRSGWFQHLIAWLGADDIRARAPVFVGDTVSVSATLVESRQSQSVDGGIWTFEMSMTNQDGAVVLSCVTSMLLAVRGQRPLPDA